MQAAADLVATESYQPERRAAAAARRFVRQTLRSWQDGGGPGALGDSGAGRDALIDDAVLLTSELVTNAVLHAGTQVRVTCRRTGNGLEIAVEDDSPAQIVAEQQLSADRTGGRGLAMPGQLATSWGVTYTARSKAVWFRIEPGELPVPPVPAAVNPARR